MRIHNLEGITVLDIFLAAQHILAVLLTALVAGKFAQVRFDGLHRLHWLKQHFFHRRNLTLCLSVIDFRIISLNVDDQKDFLLKVVKGDKLVKKH